jgi:tight adherence protein C
VSEEYDVIIIATLVFLSVSVGLAALFLWFLPSRMQMRLEAIAPPPASANWTETVVKLAGPFAKLSSPDGQWEKSPLRIQFLNAGIRNPNARVAFFALKTLLPLTLASMAYASLIATAPNTKSLTLLLYVLLAALVGCYLPNLLLRWKVRSRQREIFNTFPDAADLMLVCVEAGLGLDSALTKVAEEIRRKSTALAEELHLTNLEMRAGAGREKTLRNLALRTGIEEIGTFAGMLTQADRFGTNIGDALRVFSEDLRHKRQVRAEELAAKAPTKMLFPLVVCIFPSVIMVIMGPAIIRIIRMLSPMMGS